MTLRGNVRRASLAVALAGSLLAAGWVTSGEDRDDGELRPLKKNQPSERAPGSDATITDAVAPLKLELLRRGQVPAEQTASDPFASKSWYVPPPPPPPSPPAAPAAPVLPFIYMGRIVDGGTDTVFLTRADRTFVVKAGDVIESTYRVDSIEATLVTLTYLPLNKQQNLQIGTPN